jgi:glycerol-3-phosphate acyltransferase PlsY
LSTIILFSLLGYCLGSIPFGLVLTKLFSQVDIREIGSGNIGATNVLRTGNKKLALATLILDGTKGALAALLAIGFASQDAAIMAGLFSILGHMYPIWLKFRGGKGVATAFGLFLAITPLTGLAVCFIWLITAITFRISSLSALVATFCAPIITNFIYQDPNLSGLCSFVALLIWIKHRSNIKRLLNKEEPKIGKKKEG